MSDPNPIIERLRQNSCDISEDDFNKYALPALNNLMKSPPKDLRINPTSILLKHGINKLHFNEKDRQQKKLLESLRLILGCAYVLLHKERVGWKHTASEVTDENEFLSVCLVDEEFRSAFNDQNVNDTRDVPYMFMFWKYLMLVIQLLPEERTKTLAIQIAGRLEGSNKVYILGTSQSNAVHRRVRIYHLEIGQEGKSSKCSKKQPNTPTATDVSESFGLERSDDSTYTSASSKSSSVPSKASKRNRLEKDDADRRVTNVRRRYTITDFDCITVSAVDPPLCPVGDFELDLGPYWEVLDVEIL